MSRRTRRTLAKQPIAKPCVHCRCLEFNDEEMGGFIDKNDDGAPILGFPPIGQLHKHCILEDSLPGLPKLKSSHDDGCESCGFLRDSILNTGFEYRDARGLVSISLYYLLNDSGEERTGLLGLIAAVTGKGPPLPDDLVTVLFTIESKDEQLSIWLQNDRAINSEVTCPQNINFWRKQIQECYHHHKCTNPSGFIPTRLLDLGELPSDIPVLVETATSPVEISQYAALSYCWGPQPEADLQLRTDESTLQDRLRGIPANIMSPVMRDAVNVCRLLSVRHLWIDSLCIIQDQEGGATDWNKESQLMGKIFQNAFVTICAASSTSCQQGFLSRSFRRFPIKYESRLKPDVSGIYYLVYDGEFDFLFDPLGRDVLESSWSGRGWVFQEQTMSPRKLVFGRRMTHFWCSSTTASENGYSDERQSQPLVSRLLEFRELVEGYANMKLKDEKDRLPAIAGLAEIRNELEHDEYLAGLWKRQLFHSLLWSPVIKDDNLRHKKDVISGRQPSRDRIAPSWSWACQKDYIEYGMGGLWVSSDKDLRAEYRGLTGSVILDGTNPFGRVKSGTITMTAKMCPLPSDLYYSDHRSSRGNFRDSFEFWKVYSRNSYAAYCALDWVAGTCIDGETVSGKGLWMLLVSSSCHGRRHFDWSEAYESGEDEDDEDEDDDDEDDDDEDDEDDEDEEDDDVEDGGEHEGENHEDEDHDDHDDVEQGEKHEEYEDDGLMVEYLGRDQSTLNMDVASGNTANCHTHRTGHGRAASDSQDGNWTDLDDDGDDSQDTEAETWASRCRRCDDSNHNRHAWGLLLCESEDPGSFIRVGIFTSRAREAGGTRFFDDIQASEVVLV